MTKATAQLASDRSGEGPQISITPVPPLEQRIRRARVLVLDDEHPNLRLIGEVLSREGFEQVTTHSDVEGALREMEGLPPDLLVLDLQMPVMSGFEVLGWMTENVADDQIPVLILTGDNSADVKERALLAGARDFVTKPFQPLELTLRIRNLLQTRLLQRELRRQNERLEKQVRRRTLALQDALLRAEEANRSKSKFLAVMSHELRTPLTGIISYAELLDSGVGGAIPDAAGEMVARIHSAGWHLSHLIEDILDYSSGQTTLNEMRFQRVNVGAMLAEVADLMNPLARDQGSRIQLEVPGGDVFVFTDPMRLRRIFFNLISNGLKFSGDQTVVVSARRQVDGVEILVKDFGIGIDAQDLERIWEPFWQAEDPLTRRVGGSGLGLSIVRTQAELLGAQVGVESTRGLGSLFWLRLPEDTTGAY